MNVLKETVDSILPWSFWVGISYFVSWLISLRWRKANIQPVFLATILVIILVEMRGSDYEKFYQNTSWIIWLLNLAVVALAVPIYRQRKLIRQNIRLFGVIIIGGLAFGVFSMLLALSFISLPWDWKIILAMKSVTAPVAMEIVKDWGNDPRLVSVGSMIAGILGAAFGPVFLKWIKVTDPRAIGLAMGCTSHGAGAARALELGEIEGAFASLGMSCTAITAAVLVPYCLTFFK